MFELGQAAPRSLCQPLAMYRIQRRVVAAVLIVLGAVLMLAAPETLSGAIVIAFGVAIEIAGIALERRR